MVEGNRYCKKCGAFIPAWSDECLACGEPRGKRKIVDTVSYSPSAGKGMGGWIHREQVAPNDLDNVVNLNPLMVGARKPSVRFSKYRLKDAYVADASLDMHPVGGKTVGILTIKIIGDII